MIGNIADVRGEVPINKTSQQGRQIWANLQTQTTGVEVIVISNVQMLHKLCNETRFCKLVPEGLARVKRPGPSGLITAQQNDPDWGHAYRILMPAFGPLPIADMFDGMSVRSFQRSSRDD